MQEKQLKAPVEVVRLAEFDRNDVKVYIKREDRIHPQISGNKWRKLKYNVLEAKKHDFDTILTFGGAYSNHIAATAAAGVKFGLKTIGMIRGEEHTPLNSTLDLAVKNGMQLHYVSRSDYKKKHQPDFVESLRSRFGKFFLVPEGGANELGIKGCEEILPEVTVDFDAVCCACGTGGTLAGLIRTLKPAQQAIGFPVLKGGGFLKKETHKWLQSGAGNWSLKTEYHFGGYAKIQPELINFINTFKYKTGVPLDPVYTGKMMYGLTDLIKNNYFPKGSRVLAIHTGGLQGIKGIEDRYGVQFF